MPHLILPDQSEVHIREVEFRHGKWQYESTPDFCGTLTRVPVRKLPDRIKFNLSIFVQTGDIFTLRLESGMEYKIQITAVSNEDIMAKVIPDEKSH